MKKILLLSNMYPSEKFPHYGVFVKNCEEMLSIEGYSIVHVVIAYQTNKFCKLWSYLCFFFKALYKGVFGKYDYLYAHYASHMMLIVVALRYLKPNLIRVVNVHGNDVVPMTLAERKNPSRSRRTLDNCDVVIAPSKHFEQVLLEKYEIPKNKIKIFPSGGVNKDIFKGMDKLECRKKVGVELDCIVIGFAARLEGGKGWEVFLHAMKRLCDKNENFRYMLIGEGSQGKQCAELIRKLSLEDNGYCFPLMKQEELAIYMNAMDVFCVSSLQESLCLVGLEAMACEVPCVLSAIQGILSYAEDKRNCYTYEAGKSEMLANRIEEILCLSDEEKKKMRMEQVKTVEGYDKKKMAKKLASIFNDVQKEAKDE